MSTHGIAASRAARAWSRCWERCWSRTYATWSPFRSQETEVVSTLDRSRIYDTVPIVYPPPPPLSALLSFLARAAPVPPGEIPPDLVTMNSIVSLRDEETGRAQDVELVYPFDADRVPLGRSVTAPLGSALFGRRVGDRITWPAHHREGRAVVAQLRYQPEREGHFDR